jgi:hypothetical protein
MQAFLSGIPDLRVPPICDPQVGGDQSKAFSIGEEERKGREMREKLINVDGKEGGRRRSQIGGIGEVTKKRKQQKKKDKG